MPRAGAKSNESVKSVAATSTTIGPVGRAGAEAEIVAPRYPDRHPTPPAIQIR